MKKKIIFLAMMLLTLLGGVKWNTLNAQDNLGLNGKTFRIKVDYSVKGYKDGQYLENVGGSLSYSALNESSSGQKFTFLNTGVANQYYIMSEDSYYLYCEGSNPVEANVNLKSAIDVATQSGGYVFKLGGKYFDVVETTLFGRKFYYSYFNANSAQVLFALEEVVTVDCLQPDAPTNFTAEALTHESVQLSWNEVGNATEYYVYQDGVKIAETESTSHTVMGLTANTSYEFVVSAVCGTFETESETKSVTTPKAPRKQTIVLTLNDSDNWGSFELIVYSGNMVDGLEGPYATYVYSSGNNVFTIELDEGTEITLMAQNANSTNTYTAYYDDGEMIVESETSCMVLNPEDGKSYNYYTFTVRGPVVESNIKEINFGNVALGEHWSEKGTKSFNVVLTPELTEIVSVTIDNDFFVADKNLNDAAGANEFSFNVSYDKNATVGEKSGKIVITYMNHEDEATKEIDLSASAYTPIQGDMVENPYQVTFTNNTTYTKSVTAANMHDDYIFPNEYNEGVTPDAIFTFTLNETSLVTVNVSASCWLAVYNETFNGQGGPKADNQIDTWLNNTVMVAGTYYVLVATTEDYTIDITRQDIPLPQIYYYSPMDGEVVYENNPMLSYYIEYADSYQLFFGTSEDNLQVVKSNDFNEMYHQTENLQLGTKYYWKIEAKSAVGTNDTTAVRSFVTPLDGPQTITASREELYPDNKVTLSWDAVNSANLLGYNVYANGELIAEKISETSLTLSYSEIPRNAFPNVEISVTAVYELGESNRAYTYVNVQGQFDLTIIVTCNGVPIEEGLDAVIYTYGVDELGNQIPIYVLSEDENGKINKRLLSLGIGDCYVMSVSVDNGQGMYETVIDTIEYQYTHHNTQYVKEISLEMKGVENIVANPNPIYYSQPTTITWDAVNTNNVTYNMYVNGVKHNSAALSTTTYVINDLPYNVADGNSIEVKAVYDGVESASTPIYIKVVGTFMAQYNVKDNDGNPIEGATIVITNNFADELNNTIPQFEITTDAKGQATIALPLLPGGQSYEYYEARISKGAYSSTTDMITSYQGATDYVNGQLVERNVIMNLPSPRMAQIETKNYFIGDEVVVTWEAPDIDPLPATFRGYNIYQVPLEGENTKLNNTLLTELTYTVENLPYGTHYIGVSAVYQEGESSMTQASVKITAYGKLIGTVVDTEGNYLSGAEIVVTGYDEFYVEQTYDGIQTDKNGQFVIENMFLSGYDGYTVKATKFGYEDYTSSVDNNAHVTYNNGAASEVTVVMKSYPAVELNVKSSDEVDYAYVSWDSPVEARKYTLYRTDLSSNETIELAADLTSTNYEDESWEALANGEYQYGVSAYMEEDSKCLVEYFEDGEMPAGWSVYHSGTVSRGDWIISSLDSYDNGYAAQSPNPSGPYSNKFFMVTSLVDLTDAVTPKMSFAYYTPKGNLLRVLVLTESQGQNDAANGTQVWSNNENVTGIDWVYERNVDLSAYKGQKVYIVFESNLKTTGISAVDFIEVTSGPKYYTSKISWAAPLVKGAIIYTGTGNWNDAANWSTGEVPSASDDVTIKGQVAVTGNVNVNSITIARNQSMGMEEDDYSLTVETGSTLTITNGISNNSYSRGLVIHDGAQVFQNYADVEATFVMDIKNPTSWSDSPTEGWQIIASPLKESSTYSFMPADDDYDLYKYDGTKELQWVNHKYHTQGNFEFFYNFEDRTIPAGFTSIDADGKPVTKWYAEMYNNSSYIKELPMPSSNLGSNGCVYSEVIANADNYLVLPKSKIVEGSKLQFKAASYYSKTYAQNNLNGVDCEDVEILVSENGNTSTADFVSIEKIEVTNGSSNGVVTWKTIEIDLSAYADKEIYVALRHTSTTEYRNMLMVDDLRLVGDAFEVFEDSFVQGRGYLASYESQTTATFYGKLNHEKTFRFKDVTSYNANNDTVSLLSNFYLLGNPFTFNMNWDNVAVSGVYDGYATVNENGTYDYHTSGTINVGDGFFVQATANNPSVEYTSNRRRMEQKNVNLMVTSKNGSDNVIINFAGDANEGFKKLDNHNKEVAEIYVIGTEGRYGILNYNEDVETVDVEFDAKRLGNYTISALTEGEFEMVSLIDRATGIETNLLVDDYTFTAKANEENSRFIVKFVDGQQSTDNGQFAYQSGGELIVNAQGMVQIVDVLGRVVYQNEHSNDINRINVENFERASYVVRCVNGNEVKTQKIVIL